MRANDWMMKAAEDISKTQDALDEALRPLELSIIIAKYFPFEDHVTYMPVPRCETCAHWKRSPFQVTPRPTGECSGIILGGVYAEKQMVTASDFGCVRWEKK